MFKIIILFYILRKNIILMFVFFFIIHDFQRTGSGINIESFFSRTISFLTISFFLSEERDFGSKQRKWTEQLRGKGLFFSTSNRLSLRLPLKTSTLRFLYVLILIPISIIYLLLKMKFEF